MRSRGDPEIIISLWSPEWLNGRGVENVASWYLNTGGWRIAQVYDAIGEGITDADFDNIHGVENVSLRPQPLAPGSRLPVIFELARERQTQSRRQRGALEERIVEYAASALRCPLGFHAVDIRRPVPQAAFGKGHETEIINITRELRAEVASIRATVPIAWAVYSTFGRGPSLAELFQKQDPTSAVGGVYIPKCMPPRDLEEVLGRAACIDEVDRGYEVILTAPFGGTMREVAAPMRDGLWRVLRKAAITGLPWETLGKLGR